MGRYDGEKENSTCSGQIFVGEIEGCKLKSKKNTIMTNTAMSSTRSVVLVQQCLELSPGSVLSNHFCRQLVFGRLYTVSGIEPGLADATVLSGCCISYVIGGRENIYTTAAGLPR